MRLLSAVCAVLVLLPATAAAHRSPSAPVEPGALPNLIPADERASYHAEVLRVRPRLPGLETRILGEQEYLEVTWTGKGPLEILGTGGEPMFRLMAQGVEVNRRSPTAYAAADRFGRVPAPPDADASAPPVWQQIAEGAGPWRWHDPRIQWRGEERPEVVGAGARLTRIRRWSVPLRAGTRAGQIDGILDWLPQTSAIRAQRSRVSEPLLSAAIILVALVVGAFAGVYVRDRVMPGAEARRG